MFIVGHHQNPRSKKDTKANIESYLEASEWWTNIDNDQLQGRKVDFLVWHLTTLIVTHHMYNHGR